MISPAAWRYRDPWLGGVVIFLAVMVPLVGYLAPLGFAPLLALTGLLVAPFLLRRQAVSPPGMVLVLLVLWSLVSLSWSPAVKELGEIRSYGALEAVTGLKLLLQLALYGAAVAGLGLLSEDRLDRAGLFFALGVLGLGLVIGIEGIGGASLYQRLRTAIGDPIRPDLAEVKVSIATYALALLVWPAARLLAWRGWAGWSVILLLAIIAGAYGLSSDAVLAALAAGAVVWVSVRLAGRVAAGTLIGLVAAPFVFAPLLVLSGVQKGIFSTLHKMVPASWDARLDIWAFAAGKIQQHPLRGWGLDASRTFGPAIPLHTHNAPLQIWLELGAVGAALVGVFFAWVAYGVLRLTSRSRSNGAMAAAALTTYIVIGGLSFGVWQEWWLALGALTLIGCNLATRSTAISGFDEGELAPLN